MRNVATRDNVAVASKYARWRIFLLLLAGNNSLCGTCSELKVGLHLVVVYFKAVCLRPLAKRFLNPTSSS